MTLQAASQGLTLADLVQKDRSPPPSTPIRHLQAGWTRSSLQRRCGVCPRQLRFPKPAATRPPSWATPARGGGARPQAAGACAAQPLPPPRRHTVCEGHKGKTSSFVCPYHGWATPWTAPCAYVPSRRLWRPARQDRLPAHRAARRRVRRHDLRHLQRTTSGPSSIISARPKWMDLFMETGGGFPVKVAGSTASFPGNWKIQLEHHRRLPLPAGCWSFLSSVDEQTEDAGLRGRPGLVEDLGSGHSVVVMIPELVDLEANLDAPSPTASPSWPGTPQGLPEDQVRRIACVRWAVPASTSTCSSPT